MMPDTIRLLNPFLRAARIRVFHFYDGRAPVEGGVITIPADKKHWVQRAYIMGYRNNPETGLPYKTWAAAYASPQPATVEVERVEDSAESAGETNDEGSDAGGLPTGTDGLRESEPQGDDSPVEAPELGTGSGDEPAVGTDGDGAAV